MLNIERQPYAWLGKPYVWLFIWGLMVGAAMLSASMLMVPGS